EREQGDNEQVAVVLSRKLAVAAGYPERQKAILLRLAALQEQELGRPDVALESYRRALEIDPGCRPALAYLAARDREDGDLDAAAEAYARLAGTLAGEREPPRG